MGHVTGIKACIKMNMVLGRVVVFFFGCFLIFSIGLLTENYHLIKEQNSFQKVFHGFSVI